MKRTTIFAEESLLRQLRAAAHRRGISAAQLVREALNAYLFEGTQKTRVPSIAGRYSSGQSETSEKVDQFLWSDPHR
jgi:hypothetical protein